MEPTALTRREREIMEIVFAAGAATLAQIQDQMADAPTRPALRSLLTILENRGHLKHRKEGREFVYEATQSREKAGRSSFRRVLSTFFGGSVTQALAAHLADPKSSFTKAEIAELKALIDSAKPSRGK
ncbi:MAG: BlaI/MecI/CopY family transcriptional regulator [Prosthecobacter sp.]